MQRVSQQVHSQPSAEATAEGFFFVRREPRSSYEPTAPHFSNGFGAKGNSGLTEDCMG